MLRLSSISSLAHFSASSAIMASVCALSTRLADVHGRAGGKVESGETPAQAALRELEVNSSLHA